MSELLSSYCKLIGSPAQLAQCREAATLTELLHTIKTLWNIPGFDDDLLLVELNRLNRHIIDDASVQLAKTWLPYRYNAASRSIYWCLPDGHATEPFQDETISRYRQKISLNTLIQPQTSLDLLAHQASGIPNAQPAGFIFHLSRCGSTVVSGCLSELDSTSVLSESPVLTEVLLDPALDAAEQQRHLRHLIDLQACVFPDRSKIVIKWNAWDIFRWKLIRAVYQQTPAILLVRNPVEILASHQREAGRHMSGDPTLGFLNPVFTVNPTPEFSTLDFRIGVFAGLLAEMQSISMNDAIRRLDYRQLDLNKLVEICEYFHIPIDETEVGRIKARLAFHSKLPGLHFDKDSTEKQNLFSATETAHIQKSIMPLYVQFFDNN